MLQLLTCSQGHSWEAEAAEEIVVGRAACPVCGEAVELAPLIDLAPEAVALAVVPEPILPQAPPLRDAAGKPVVAGFEILEEIGRSPLGVRLFKAKQLLVNRLVLLKVVTAREDAGQVGWGALRGEAAALGRLNHPNIPSILEAGERERQLFYNAVEWVEGPTLSQYAVDKSTPPRQAARLVEVLARAVHAAHEYGVVHRCLRPACVRLQPMPEGDRRRKSEPADPPFFRTSGAVRCLPKIGDFGLARRPVEGDPADVELYEDAPTGLSPEQAWGRGREIGPPSDIYALGAILYELLAGRPPFHGRTPGETLDFIRGGNPPALHGRAPHGLAAICRKAMQRNPRNRYRTALEFAEDLRAFVSYRPIKANRRGAIGRLILWTRRRPLAGLFVLLLLLAPVAVLIAYAVGAGDAAVSKTEVDNAHVLTAAADAQKVNVQKDLADSQAREKRTAYFRNILLADREFHGGDADRARQLLADCTTDLRQWEWYYLNYRLNDPNAEEYLRRTGPEQPISTILFSPDGRWLAAASAGDDPDPKPDVRIWDATAPDAVHVLTGFRAPVHGMAFNPDGKRLATVASAHNNFGEAVGELKEWDPAKGELLDVLALNNAQPADAAYSSDGKRLVVVDDDGKLHAFTPGGKGEIALNLQTAADWAPRTFHLALLSPDGGKVAVVAAGGLDVQIYDTTRARTATRAAHHADEITALTFSPETNLLASAGRDGTLMIWDVTANRSVTPAALHAHIGAVTGASFTRDGRRLATSGEDGFVRIWDPATGQEVYQFQPFDAGDSITAVRFSPAKNDERLAAAHGTEVRIFGPPRP